MIVPPPNVKCSILLTVATALTVLIRCFKQCSQQQPYVVLQQMYWISETRNIQSRQIKNTSKIHHVKYIYDDTMSKYHMWLFSEIVQGRRYEIKAYPIQLHLLIKKCHVLMLETVLVPFSLKARMRLIFHALLKLVF